MKKGFSFVEVLVAFVIASSALTAIIALSVQNISAAQVTRDKFTAANLAQEGIEIVVNLRSNNWLAYPQTIGANVDGDTGELIHWRDGGGNIAADGVSFITQYDSMLLTDEPDAGDQNLVRLGTGRYCHAVLPGCSGGTSTPFSRVISLDTISDHQMKVTSQVSWTYHNQNYSVNVEDRLYNWR